VGVLEEFRLDGKTALVTGASRGLGAAIAVAFAEAGADVICHGNSRSPEETCAQIRRLGRRTIAVQADLSRPDGAQHAFEQGERFAPVDILVNNAGAIHRSPAAEYRDEDWAFILEVNLNSVFRLCRMVGARWLQNKRTGKIINLASLLAFQGGITVPAYASSKGAVGQLSKALANEWAGRGINVNAIVPGYMNTDNTVPLQQNETRNRQILERIPAGRWGQPEDICGAAVFLASDASRYVHGHLLVVDGGWMAR
jgi:2-dehydro-3-deoxy-D-gluconate 5-dehydrogenase